MKKRLKIDDYMSVKEAAARWNINPSSLRDKIDFSYNKELNAEIEAGLVKYYKPADAKIGYWIISADAMCKWFGPEVNPISTETASDIIVEFETHGYIVEDRLKFESHYRNTFKISDESYSKQQLEVLQKTLESFLMIGRAAHAKNDSKIFTVTITSPHEIRTIIVENTSSLEFGVSWEPLLKSNNENKTSRLFESEKKLYTFITNVALDTVMDKTEKWWLL